VPPPRPRRAQPPAFVADGARLVLSEGGLRATGLEGGGDFWTCVTSARLGAGRTVVELVLVKEGRYAASFGVLREGAERGELLGYQPGGVGLFCSGDLLVDGGTKRKGLPRFGAGSRVRLEHDGEAHALTFTVDGAVALQWKGDFVSWSVAVGGDADGVVWEVVEPTVRAPLATKAPTATSSCSWCSWSPWRR